MQEDSRNQQRGPRERLPRSSAHHLRCPWRKEEVVGREADWAVHRSAASEARTGANEQPPGAWHGVCWPTNAPRPHRRRRTRAAAVSARTQPTPHRVARPWLQCSSTASTEHPESPTVPDSRFASRKRPILPVTQALSSWESESGRSSLLFLRGYTSSVLRRGRERNAWSPKESSPTAHRGPRCRLRRSPIAHC